MTPNLSASPQPAQPVGRGTPARPKRPSRQPASRARTAQERTALPRPGQPPAREASGTAAGALDTRVPQLPVRIGSPVSLLAVIPALLGFGPGRSLVVVGTGPGTEVRLTLRYDLPDPAHPLAATALARHATSVLAAQGVKTAVAVGYGAEAAVYPVAAALRERAAAADITFTELLRVDAGRYWSYVCTDPACCPAEGTPFDVADHPDARALAAAGGQVLADRDHLAATLAPVKGELGTAMRRETEQAQAQLAGCVARLHREGLRMSPSRLTIALGQLAVADAIRRYRDGGRVGTEHAAWLIVALREQQVRDDAWARMDPEHRAAHLRLWTELTRLARRGYVAAPASLLAVVAWQSGDGALANVALDRALADSPRYSMAQLLRRALDSGAHPSLARPPMTPEEVAASYEAMAAQKRSRTAGLRRR